MVSYDSLRVFVDSICPFNADSIAWHLRAMGNPILKIHTNGLLPLLLASFALPTSAQVSSENYVQTTQRISDTQVLTTTQYYDGLGRPFEKVEQGVTPSGDNLIHLQQYDGLGREWRSWNPIYSSSAFLNPSDVSSLSQSQYSDSHAFSQNNYESCPLNRVVEVEGIGEDWKGHSVKSDHLVNSSSFPLNCKYYRVSMSGELQNKGYYPEGRLYVTKTTDEDGHESYEFKNLAGHVILQRVILGGTESADTYYIYDYRGNLSFNIMGKDEVLYDYNVRNWPLSIESDNFKERLCYNVCNNGLCSWRNLYNGNIGAMSWQCGNGIKRAFHFTYNAQNMLTDSSYNEGDRLNDWQGNYDESLSYDKMGNVQSLLRSGLLDDGSYGLIDNLSYNYHGNQLLKVDDAAVGPYYQGAFHFVDGADEAVEYEYDANGNMVRDLNKGISFISYDLNNQPRKIEYNDGRNASYVYDAEGNKLSVSYNLTAMSSAQPQMPVMQSTDVASANVSNGQKTIDYCGNIIYDGDETMILNDVGYALCNKDNNFSFHYYLKDHLGNNRVVVSEDGEIEQVNDYYPTGALMASSMGGDTQRFKYNGKELDRVNGLNWYDYGARNYDAEIVVWKGVDKMADKNVTTSLYGYCNSNPMRFIDPLGTDTVDLLPSPQQDYRSYTLKLDAKYFDDDPNVINVWGHGDNDGIDYNGKTLSSARDFDEMLKEHSEVWKNHAQGNPAIIVLHSCSTADFAKILSASDLFRNVLIIGPTENVKVSFYKSKLIKYDRKSGYAFYKGHYENTKVETVSRWGKVKSGIWIGYRNGKYYNSYDGGEKTRYQSDEKPGGKGFEYRTLWDRIKSCF